MAGRGRRRDGRGSRCLQWSTLAAAHVGPPVRSEPATTGGHVSDAAGELPDFDFPAFFAAVDDARRRRDLNWYTLADELWDLSVQLNAERDDHPLCGGAVSRLGQRGETSCQYALYLLRWLEQPPEAFLVGPTRHVGDARLPEPGPDGRLRWDLAQLHAALDEERQRQGLTWAALGEQIGCAPGRLTRLR